MRADNFGLLVFTMTSLTPLPQASYDAIMRCFALLLILLVGLFSTGCDNQSSPASPPPDANAAQTDGPRLVTLAPALSQMLVDLGLSDAIVGVSEHDAAAPPGLPIVGNYTAVDTEALLAVKPTHVLMMAGPAGAPPRLRELAEQGLFKLSVFPFPLSVPDIERVLVDDTQNDQPDLGSSLGVTQQAMALKLKLLKQLAAIQSATADQPKPNVLLVLGTQPTVLASGPGTVHNELLDFAGGLNAAADATVTAPEYDRESLIALHPDVILLLMPNAPALKDNDPRLAVFEGLPIPAVEHKRIYLLNDPLVLLPSTSVAGVCAEMAKAIHPDLTDAIDNATRQDPARP